MASSGTIRILGLFGWLAICFVAAGTGAAASVDAQDFYASLIQPDWAPPAWLFGPVWTALYFMMAVSAWLVWIGGRQPLRRLALLVFCAQLVLNVAWSWLFFAWRLGMAALIDVLMLWALILLTLVLFWRIRTLAGILLAPYLLWVSFAAILNYSVWQLNPALLA